MNLLLLGTASAFGLAASAGLNTTLPLLLIGVLARAGLLSLASPFNALASEVAIAGLIVLTAIELVGDKLPALDSFFHAVQLPLAATAGAILFASQSSLISNVSPGLAILVGLLVAGGVHGTRAAVRPAVTTMTLGTGNTFVSFAEDIYAFLLAIASVLSPWLALLLVAALIVAIVFSIRLAFKGGRKVLGRFRGQPALRH